MSVLEQIRVHPIKSLDATSVESTEIVANGGLAWDRRYAIVEATDRTETASDAPYVNGKREPKIHRLAAEYDLDRATVTVRDRDGDEESTFHLERDRDGLAAWLSDRLGYSVAVVGDDEGGFPDDTDASGPTVISDGTLEAVASWYDGIDSAEMCRRLRSNLVVGGVPAFWEDRLYEEPERVVPFTIGEVSLEGVNPCQRCVVPTRDPDTGEETDGFRERFVERREATLPEWASEAWFDHYFRLMVNTRVPESAWGATLSVSDGVSVADSHSNR
ncbi:MOSC domain-containing protein [Natronococcus pandeyae]|uniref:MOSC domain-containing protein n=1 Tax=Natronococcus pandeyae TaxID=2055836 RepID=A0A8J8Q0R2_9EURY|nr:MOSC N-terminal beta barrel domain-containing protein [Natronococcus pandeyae]TYL36679.1 MOSC domain-containing protein [Natronococcus pandeyae]